MQQPVMELKIAPVMNVIQDLKQNKKWIAIIAIVWIAYTSLSSLVICMFEDWGYSQSLYFTLINMTTVGFGDITPLTIIGKIIAMVNSVIGLVLFGIFVASITMALQPSSFSGSAIPQSAPSCDPESKNNNGGIKNVKRSNQEKISRYFDALNELISLDENSDENNDKDSSETIHISIRGESYADKSKKSVIFISIKNF